MLQREAAGDSVSNVSVTVFSSRTPAYDGEHLTVFIAEQVQREASSTIEGAGWLQHCYEGNTITHQGTKTKTQKGEETLRGLRKLLFFPPLFYFATMHSTENISSTQQVCYPKGSVAK